MEPIEIAYIDVPEEFSGTIINKLNERKGELQGMSPSSDGTVRLEYHIPSRGLIGFRGDFLTSTKGTGIMNTAFDGYAPYKADMFYRKLGSLIAFEAGETVTYGLFSAQDRGTLFVGAGEKVYSGMVDVYKRQHLFRADDITFYWNSHLNFLTFFFYAQCYMNLGVICEEFFQLSKLVLYRTS